MAESKSAAKTAFYRSKWFNLTVGILVTLGCLWWAFDQMLHGSDGRKTPGEVFGEIGQAFRSADYRTLPLMWTCLALFYFLKALRWRYLLKPIGEYRVLRDLLPSTLVGFAFNNVLPAHLGEFVRVFVFSRQSGIAKTSVLTTIVLERLFDVVAILGFLLLGLFLVDTSGLDERIVMSAWIFGAAVCVGLLVAAGYLIWTHPVVRFIEKTLDRLNFIPDGIKEKLADIMEAGEQGLSSLRSVKLFVGIIWTSAGQWFLNGLLIWLALKAFDIQVTPAVAAIVLGATAFGVTVPSSPGYFGVVQLCFMAVLKLFTDDSRSLIFSASIYYHMAQWLPVTVVGMFFFLKQGYSVADVETAKEAAEEALDEVAETNPLDPNAADRSTNNLLSANSNETSATDAEQPQTAADPASL